MSDSRMFGEQLRTRQADPMDRLAWHDENPVQALTVEQYAELKQSIKERGYLASFPVVVSAGPACEGQIIDGFHRSQVCEELGIEPVTVLQPCATEAEFHVLQVETNVARRQMTAAQVVHARFKNRKWYEQRAKERMALNAAINAGRLTPENFPDSERGETRDAIAEGTSVTGRTADKMMAVFEAAEQGDELAVRLSAELLAGEISASKAERMLRPQAEQDALDEAVRNQAEAEREINETYFTQHEDTAADERNRAVGEVIRHFVEAEAVIRRHALTGEDVAALRSRPHTFKGTARRLNEWLGEIEEVL